MNTSHAAGARQPPPPFRRAVPPAAPRVQPPDGDLRPPVPPAPSPAAAPPPEVEEDRPVVAPTEYVVVRPFRGLVDRTTVTLTVGQIVRGAPLIERLLRVRAPIVPRGESGQILTCPHCGKAFAPEEETEAE